MLLSFSISRSTWLGFWNVDPGRRIARVQPGVILDHLRRAAEKHRLTFAPDPATHDRCTLGGMIGNNSCGVHSVMAGKTDDNIESLDILTYDGLRMPVGATSDEELESIIRAGGRRAEIYAGLKSLAAKYGELVRQKFPNIPRRVSGYNLNYLLPENGFHVARALVGSEGTCVTVLEATCQLVESPQERVLLVVAWPDIFLCADNVPLVMSHKPIGLEGFDDILVTPRAARVSTPKAWRSFPMEAVGCWLNLALTPGRSRSKRSRADGITTAVSPFPPTCVCSLTGSK